jgi:hypothetical protein
VAARIITPSVQCQLIPAPSILRDLRFFDPTKSGLDPLDAVAARGNHRIDELAVGVFIATIDELREEVRAVGSLVVDAVEIERPERIVRGTDQEQSREPAGRTLDRVAQRRSLERGQLLAGAAAEIGPPGSELVRPRRRRRRRPASAG